MSPKLIFGFAMTVLLVGMSLAVLTVFKTGRDFSSAINNRSNTWSIENVESNRGAFALKRVSYSSDIDCSSDEGAPVNIEFVVKPKEITRGCELYLDYKFVRELDLDSYDCSGCSPDESVASAVSTPALDPRRKHKVEICCDDICIEHLLVPFCAD
ncbi:hypothetical protein D6764_03720 [Candidatus Woesearchaeota archaeon]|nr:MAG: hypothetical protein D6764_03720 [Candidatus Woesearchaeota archaeon]